MEINYKDLIKVGDEVILVYMDKEYEVTILNMPRGGGDLLQVKNKDGGSIMAINPHCLEFNGLIKKEVNNGSKYYL